MQTKTVNEDKMFLKQVNILVQICALLALIMSCETNYTPFETGNQSNKTMTYSADNTNQKGTKTKINLVIEPTENGYLPQKFLNISAKDDLPALFKIKRSYAFEGKIGANLAITSNKIRENSVSTQDIYALVSDTIAIVDYESESKKNQASEAINTTNTPSTINEKTGQFTFSLIAGQNYKILFNAKGKHEIPPSIINAQINNNTTKMIDLNYIGSTLSGTIIFKQFTPYQIKDAYSVKILQNGQLVSSAGKLNEKGEFFVQLSYPLFRQSDKKNKLTLTAYPTNEFQHLPIIEEDFSLDPPELTNQHLHILDIEVITAKIENNKILTILNEKNEPIIGAKIILLKLEHKRPIIQILQTDQGGKVAIKALHGNYTLYISLLANKPSINYKYNNWKIKDSLEETIVLSKSQKPAHGKVVDYNYDPVAGALITITRVEENPNSMLYKFSENDIPRFEARTNQAGTWCRQIIGSQTDECYPVELDEGQYEATIIPPPGSKLAHQSLLFTFAQNEDITIKLKKPTTIHGQIVDLTTQDPINKAFVKIYSSITNSKENYTPLMLGQAITNENGEFVAYINLE